VPRTQQATQHLVVVGGGMVAQRLVEALLARDADGRWRISVFAEEPVKPYDRVALTSYFSARDAEELTLGDPALWDEPRVQLYRDRAVTAIDREARTVTDRLGETWSYDELVLATGSAAAVPPIPGHDLSGVFVYRTIDDVAALRGWVEDRREERAGRRYTAPVRGAVIGGGLLGLEAAGALRELGAQATVVQNGTHLMNAQIDLGGGQALSRLINELGIAVRCGASTNQFGPRRGTSRVGRLQLEGGGRLDVDVVVLATGVRPRDELARAAGLPVGDRGGVLVDERCHTEDPRIWAIGEVACIDGRCIGLVAPGYAMAEVVTDRLLGGNKKLVLSDDGRRLLGGVFVGDATAYASLRPMLGAELPGDPAAYLLPEGGGPAVGPELADEATVCSCNNVTAGEIRSAVRTGGCTDLAGVKACTRAGTSCGSCLPLVKKLTAAELEHAGVSVSNALCEHFELTRSQLFDGVRVTGLHTFTEIIARFGSATATGPNRGCDICRPVVASILASLGNGHILDGEQAALQDTNDHVLANMQRDGTYSVVPRIPGGEITPDGLLAIGQVAKDFGLYTKITGGQRIDMFGARIDQLPDIWTRLVAHGFESGHAYGKAMRTVKSCVGSTWCRYGVQDSVGLAVQLELRYRGLRSPHKLKLGVSGCARECAEARSKDVGVIATDKGWNLYVGGNGGFTPRHARLLAEDLDTETLVRTIDRFLMYYIRTADRLQRTAAWIEEVTGGLDGVREVVLDDSLGIAADLDAAMAEHVAGYSDEWQAVLEDPEKLRRFSSFVNAPRSPDPDLGYLPERGQLRPATSAERAAGADTRPTLIAPAVLEVRS